MKVNLTWFNLMMFGGGLAVMLVALYRIAPLKLEGVGLKAFLYQTMPLLVALIIIIVWLFLVGGLASEEKAFKATFSVTASFLPVIFLLFPVMAFAGVLVKYYQTDISRMLTGEFGYPGTLFAAFVVPTTNAAADAVKTFWEDQNLRPMILYFLTAVALVCWPVYFFRVLGLTPEIGWEMYKANCIVAVGISPAFWLWSRAVAYGGWKAAIVSLLWFP